MFFPILSHQFTMNKSTCARCYDLDCFYRIIDAHSLLADVILFEKLNYNKSTIMRSSLSHSTMSQMSFCAQNDAIIIGYHVTSA